MRQEDLEKEVKRLKKNEVELISILYLTLSVIDSLQSKIEHYDGIGDDISNLQSRLDKI